MKKVIGVCACPAGIAHTYMAAENLETVAKQKGYEAKIETNGSSGVENPLTIEDISQAEFVIIAADTRVEMERFRGKKLIEVSVTDAIRNAEKIFNEVEQGRVSEY
ncbi:PTS fructose transporter subunit IIB [Atopococcus tabaci]|uniref:PTS fructose transporter subunit IIB n=1 Tax=Atopococcus tabaci TaxID=269774 RepID=UPI000427A56E|nr:PTS fructose transporter subunit IIB [Atopococcus tabaci]